MVFLGPKKYVTLIPCHLVNNFWLSHSPLSSKHYIAISCRSQTGIWPNAVQTVMANFHAVSGGLYENGKFSVSSLSAALRFIFGYDSGLLQSTLACSPSLHVFLQPKSCNAAGCSPLHYWYHEPQMHAASRNVHPWKQGMSDISNVECRRSRRPTIHVQ